MDVVRPLPNPGSFLASTRLEWRKVEWPTSPARAVGVVSVTIAVLTGLVFAIDSLFTKLLLHAF